jgi:hypothetical protein
MLCAIRLARRRVALPSQRVARVSRLIGKFDTTAKPHHWQVRRVRRNRLATVSLITEKSPAQVPFLVGDDLNATNATHAGWRFDARYSHWPPGKWRAVNRIRRSYCRLPGWHFLLEGRSLAIASAGCLRCLGGLEFDPAARLSLAPYI